MRPADGCVIDLDGTVYQGERVVPGAAEAIQALEAAVFPYCFATNTTRYPRTALVERLAGFGITVRPDRLLTAPVAAARWLAAQGVKRVSLLLAEATWEEFTAFERDDERPQAVVVGDLGDGWTFDRLNTAFRTLLGGARLVAIQKNRFWDDGSGLKLDAGPFVAALEYATQREAVLVGKPSSAFFTTAAAALGVSGARVAVVGDSIDNDVRGAQAAGCLGVAVRTGTFHPQLLQERGVQPDGILDSLAGLPQWLGL